MRTDLKPSRKAFEAALVEVIENAPDKERQALFDAFKAYREPRRILWTKIRAKLVFDCIEDGLSDFFMQEELEADSLNPNDPDFGKSVHS